MSKISRPSGWDRNLHYFNKNRYPIHTKDRYSKIQDISSSDSNMNYSSETDELDQVRRSSDEQEINVITKSSKPPSNKFSKPFSDKSSKPPSDKSPQPPSDKSPKPPSDKSSKQPSDKSSKQPSKQPSKKPSKQPSKQPSKSLYGNRPSRFTGSRSADQGFKTSLKHTSKKCENKDGEITTYKESEGTCQPIYLFFVDKKNGLTEKSTTKCEGDNIIESSFKEKHTRMGRKRVNPRFKKRNNRILPPIGEKSSLPMTPNDRDIGNEITSNTSPVESENSETKEVNRSRVFKSKAPSRFDPPKSGGKNVRVPRLETMSIEQALKILEKNGPIPDILDDESIFAAAKEILKGSEEPDVTTNSTIPTTEGDKNLSIDFDESSDNSDNSNSGTETPTISSDKTSRNKVKGTSTFQDPIQPPIQSIKPTIIDAPTQSTFKSDIKPHVQHAYQSTFKSDIKPHVQPTFQSTVQPTFQPTVQTTVQPTFQSTVQPTVQPTFQSTVQPTVQHTFQPTVQHTFQPTVQPTVQHSVKPTVQPSVKLIVQPTVQSGDSDSKDTSTLQVIKGQIDGGGMVPLMPFITTAGDHHVNPNINMGHLSVTKTSSKPVIHNHDVTDPITVLDPSNTVMGGITGPVNMTPAENFKKITKVGVSPSINESPDVITGIVGVNIMQKFNSSNAIKSTIDISKDGSEQIDTLSFKG